MTDPLKQRLETTEAALAETRKYLAVCEKKAKLYDLLTPGEIAAVEARAAVAEDGADPDQVKLKLFAMLSEKEIADLHSRCMSEPAVAEVAAKVVEPAAKG